MKIKNYANLFFLVVIGLFLHLNSFSQDKESDCRVLLHSISDTYQGSCKNGFAHGKGIAIGKDRYEGKFKKGLPNGVGIYTWANGNIYNGQWKMGRKQGVGTYFSSSNGKSIKGYWKEDEFIKEIVDPGYRVVNKYNILSISPVNIDENGNKIVIKFIRDGKVMSNIDNLNINVNNGSLTQTNSFSYRSVTYPWTCVIRFTSYTRLSSQAYQCSANIEITQKGAWEIEIKY